MPDRQLKTPVAFIIFKRPEETTRVFAEIRKVMARGNRGELVNQLAAAVAADSRVFNSDAGPVLVERGKRQMLTVERLMNFIGTAFVLVTKGPKGDLPTDLQRETGSLVLAALNT